MDEPREKNIDAMRRSGPGGFAPPIARLIGMRAVAFEEGSAVLELDADGRHANPMGTLHGGVLCDLADLAMGVACYSTLESGESFTTLELKINFLKPIWTGRLTAPGTGQEGRPRDRASRVRGPRRQGLARRVRDQHLHDPARRDGARALIRLSLLGRDPARPPGRDARDSRHTARGGEERGCRRAGPRGRAAEANPARQHARGRVAQRRGGDLRAPALRASERVAVPTLVISVADDLFGTFDGARYTAEHVPGARFKGYPSGGHVWVGHHKEIVAEIAAFLK